MNTYEGNNDMPKSPAKHTVVQHSGYGYGKDATFMRGLESRAVSTKKEQDVVTKAGGVLFDSYAEAEEFAEAEMYKGDEEGFSLSPRATGEFSEKTIDGLRIYVPLKSEPFRYVTASVVVRVPVNFDCVEQGDTLFGAEADVQFWTCRPYEDGDLSASGAEPSSWLSLDGSDRNRAQHIRSQLSAVTDAEELQHLIVDEFGEDRIIDILDEMVHDDASHKASAINNSGIEAQIRYLAEGPGLKGVATDLAEALFTDD